MEYIYNQMGPTLWSKPKPGSSAASGKAEGLAIIPLAVDTFGGLHTWALEVISRLGWQLAHKTDGEQGMVVRTTSSSSLEYYLSAIISHAGGLCPLIHPPGGGKGRGPSRSPLPKRSASLPQYLLQYDIGLRLF